MPVRNKTIVITGGAGFIGSHLCERLVAANKVIAYDIGHRNVLRFTSLPRHRNFSFVEGDILDTGKLAHTVSGADMVIHCAAVAGIDTVVKRPIETMRINLLGTQNILAALNPKTIKKFIYFSTSEVYGPYIYKGEEDHLTSQGKVGEMRWTYAVSKLAGEHFASCYREAYSLPLVIIRPFNVFGPRQMGEGAIQKFIRNALLNKPLVVNNEGAQIRSWCYIDDFIAALLAALEKNTGKNVVFNIGNPFTTITTLNLAQTVKRLSKSRSPIQFVANSNPDVEVRVPSIDRARKVLGYEPKTGLEEGILKTIAWFKKHPRIFA